MNDKYYKKYLKYKKKYLKLIGGGNSPPKDWVGREDCSFWRNDIKQGNKEKRENICKKERQPTRGNDGNIIKKPFWMCKWENDECINITNAEIVEVDTLSKSNAKEQLAAEVAKAKAAAAKAKAAAAKAATAQRHAVTLCLWCRMSPPAQFQRWKP